MATGNIHVDTGSTNPHPRENFCARGHARIFTSGGAAERCRERSVAVGTTPGRRVLGSWPHEVPGWLAASLMDPWHRAGITEQKIQKNASCKLQSIIQKHENTKKRILQEH